MKSEKEYFHIAVQMLRAALITGDEGAITQVLLKYFPLFSLSDEQLLMELQGVMVAYSTLLSHLDIFAAAQRPEFFGLRELIKHVQEKRLQEEIVDEMLMDLDTQIHFSFYGFYPLFTEEVEVLPAYRKHEDTCLEIERQFLSLRSRQMLGNKVQLIEVEHVAQQLQQLEERIEEEEQHTGK